MELEESIYDLLKEKKKDWIINMLDKINGSTFSKKCAKTLIF